MRQFGYESRQDTRPQVDLEALRRIEGHLRTGRQTRLTEPAGR
jgi:hypothetical protein